MPALGRGGRWRCCSMVVKSKGSPSSGTRHLRHLGQVAWHRYAFIFSARWGGPQKIVVEIKW